MFSKNTNVTNSPSQKYIFYFCFYCDILFKTQLNGGICYPTNWIFKMIWVNITQVWPTSRKRGIYRLVKDIKTRFVCIIFLIVHLKEKHIVLEIKSKLLCSGMDEIGALIIEITTTKPISRCCTPVLEYFIFFWNGFLSI